MHRRDLGSRALRRAGQPFREDWRVRITISLSTLFSYMCRRLEERLQTKFNVVLLRLYFGTDTIAYHTDAREFLGKSCYVASVSLGETRRFDMKRVEGPLWPTIASATPSESIEEPLAKKIRPEGSPEVISFDLSDGDLFVMCGETQQRFYHAVPPQPKVKQARFNLNFRRIIFSAGQDVALRGHDTYYKYCVTGDDTQKWRDKAKTFSQIKPVTISDFFSK